MDTFRRDLIWGVRMLAAQPGLSIIAVLALALGIGANTAIFSVVHAVLLRPLPHIRDSGRLVQIWGSTPEKNIPFHNVFYADAIEWRKQGRSFEAMCSVSPASMNLTTGGDPERISVWRVNAGFFKMLGTPLFRGRDFLPEEDKLGGPKIAILAHNLWQSRYGSATGSIGSTILLDGEGYTVTECSRLVSRYPEGQ